mgnify:FL=1
MDRMSVINFIVNNDKLELLKARLNRFNPFKILKIQDHEIRHSNVLSWILDPNGNHNFDDRILKRFLLKVILKPENDEILEHMNIVYEIQQMSLMDMKVYREFMNIDIVLVSEHQHMVVYIENKVHSSEHSNQLKRYYDFIQRTYPGYIVIPIFLTLDGIAASHKSYYSASYDDLLDTIEFIISNYKERTSAEVTAFLNYYITVLKEKYFMDEELRKLCKDIYQHNKDVIDMIYSVGNQIDIEPAINQLLETYKDVVFVSKTNTTFWFGIADFVKARVLPQENWGGGFPICLWFSEYYGKLKLTFEVGPFEDASKRVVFLNKLESCEIKISQKAKEPGRK